MSIMLFIIPAACTLIPRTNSKFCSSAGATIFHHREPPSSPPPRVIPLMASIMQNLPPHLRRIHYTRNKNNTRLLSSIVCRESCISGEVPCVARRRVIVRLPNRVWSWGKFTPHSSHSDSCLGEIEKRSEQGLGGEVFCFV